MKIPKPSDIIKPKTYYIVETYHMDGSEVIEFSRRQYKTKRGADNYCAKFVGDDFYTLVRYECDVELPGAMIFGMVNASKRMIP